MLEAASLVIDHEDAPRCAAKLIWTRMAHTVSDERCAASCDASAIDLERDIGQLDDCPGVIGFAAEEDDVKNDVTSSGLCTTHGWPMAIARVVWHYSKSDRPVTADFPK